MKKRLMILFTCLILFLTTASQGVAGDKVNIAGYIATDNRLQIDDQAYTWNENRLNLKFEGAPSAKYHYYSEIRLRGFGFPEASTSADLQRQDKDLVYGWGWQFIEGYVDLYGFGSENLDIRIGRQIVAWGTADKINPTNNISPDDLEDIFNFGAQLGSNAIQANYYAGDITLTGVFVPVFTPATLPKGNFSTIFSASIPLPQGMILRNFSDRIMLPENKISQTSQFAFKIATTLFNNDVSLSYFNGRDDLPLVNKITLTTVDNLGGIDLQAELIYPRMQVIGADFAGSIGSVGIWAESALFLPDKVPLQTMIPTPYGMQTQQTVALDDKPYLKYVIGGDYTFKNGLYVNAQFIHGFFHERGDDNLNDYFAFQFEKKFFNDALRIVPFGGAIAINDWDHIKDNFGFVGNPEMTYYPEDNVALTAGAFWLEGKGENIFSKIKKFDEVYIKVKVSF